MSIAVWSSLSKPLHPMMIAKALGAEYSDGVKQTDWLVIVGSSPKAKDVARIAKDKGIKVLLYWVGQDVYETCINPHWQNNIPFVDIHCAVHHRNVDELRQIGILAKELKFFSPLKLQTVSIKKQRKVAVYFPKEVPKFERDSLLEIIQSCPKVEFVIYGQEGDYEWPSNCKSIKKITPEACIDLIAESSLLLRYTKHDGFPQNIIQAKMLGRHVVSSWPYEGCMWGTEPQEIAKIINRPEAHFVDSTQWPEWYRNHCTKDAFEKEITNIMQAYEFKVCG